MLKPLTQWALAATLSLAHASAAVREIYFNDFEAATPGDNNLVDYDLWFSSDANSRGSHGIDAEAVQGLGQSAFLGFNNPFGLNPVSVLREIVHDPAVEVEHIIRLIAVVGINDSENSNNRDLFFIGFVNSNFQTIASLSFDNTEVSYGLWRDDGTAVHDTDEEFIRGEVQLLVAEIDTANNTWTVELDGLPIFRDEEFTAMAGQPIDLFATAISWQRGGGFGWGDNWMLFDDWTVEVDTAKSVIPANPFKIDTVARDENDCAKLTWKAQPGFTYQVEYSDDLVNWRADLPGSIKTEPVERDTSYLDSSSSGVPNRAYRIVRTAQ